MKNILKKILNAITEPNDPLGSLKMAIWLYFLLLIFEGALRKWFLPFLATPLLIIRDPIAIWAIYEALKRNLLPRNVYLMVLVPIGVISIFTAVLFGHGNFIVAVFGVRPLLFHFPFLFVMAKNFTRQDVVKVGKVLIWIAFPMTVLVALQFYSPQSAWINRGVGGNEEGAGYSGALGYFRPPGTFSFSNGNSSFFAMLSCFVFYFWLNVKSINKWVLAAATGGLIVAIPLSISRGLLFTVVVIALFVLLAIMRKPKYLTKMLGASVGLAFIVIILSQLPVFQTAMSALSSRFETASSQEGGVEGTLGNRYIGGMLKAFDFSDNIPFFGYGAGTLTNVGSSLLSGRIIGGLSEGEWGRQISELGPLFGLTVTFMRFMLCLDLFLRCYKKLGLGDLLPWILLPFCLLYGPQANWSQPTSLGFSVFCFGLAFASLNSPKSKQRLYI